MTRAWVWIQLIIGWLPVWALYTALIVSQHRQTSVVGAAFVALRAIVAAALLGLVVQRFTIRRLPWPERFRASFVGSHVLAAVIYSAAWVGLAVGLENLLHGRALLEGPVGPISFHILGIWFYVMVAGVSYAADATARAHRAELAARDSQLAALRSQLNPHFLFNALHTVVHLISREPKRAALAAEQVAGLLRTTLEDERDIVSLDDEWRFVEQYLAIEKLRFGDRLVVVADIDRDARSASLPSFSVQTLVENAVIHGAAPRVEPTTVTVKASLGGGVLTVRVHDTGEGAAPQHLSNGTGLARLRERLLVLYGDKARLDVSRDDGGFAATLTIPALREAQSSVTA